MRRIQPRSERLRILAAECGWKGGLLCSLSFAAMAWTCALFVQESLWGFLLAPAGVMTGLWGACLVMESWRVYRMAIQEAQWEELRRRAQVEGML
jgi:hypothetical protein